MQKPLGPTSRKMPDSKVKKGSEQEFQFAGSNVGTKKKRRRRPDHIPEMNSYVPVAYVTLSGFCLVNMYNSLLVPGN